MQSQSISLRFQTFLKQFWFWMLFFDLACLLKLHVTKTCCSPHIFITSFPNASCRSRQWCHITGIELSKYVVTMKRAEILTVLRSEIPSGMSAKLRTVAASNNRVHMPWSLYYCLFAPHICMVLFFTHIPFVVNHTFNSTPPERLQQLPSFAALPLKLHVWPATDVT